MATVEGAHNYVYDDIYRLTNASHPAGSPESYTYDKVGNRKTSRDYPTWNCDANNRLTSFNGTTFTYDNNGNTISKTKSGQTTNYTYDYENRLSRVFATPPQAGEAIYTYDPFGRRLSKTVNGVTKYYLYDNEDIIAEYDNVGNMIASYVHGQGIDEPIARTDNRIPRTDYYTFDGLGSVSELTDSGQNIAEAYKYDSFGNLQTPPATGNPYTYASREYDIETGLYFYRARYYDANVGRFLIEDPIRFDGGINFYIYVENNSINYVDSSGLGGSWCPRYGNYCGIDWSGGKEIRAGEIGPDVAPVDAMDKCCKEHDKCVYAAEHPKDKCSPGKRKECDKALGKCLRNLPSDPKQWQPPAKDPKRAQRYRDKAEWAFK